MNHIVEEDIQGILSCGYIDWERFRGKTVLVTGGYGMLASYLTYTFLELNRRGIPISVWVLGKNEQKAKSRFAEFLGENYLRFISSDLTAPIQLEGELHFILHAASMASSQYYDTNPVEVMLPNVIGTYQLLELARQKQVEGFLLFSSGEVYGAIQTLSVAEADYGYLDPINVRSCYAESKRAAECMCKCWQHEYGVPTKIVRPCHTFGPTMDLVHDNRVFSEFVKNAVCHEDIALKSDGLSERTFCYISDASKAYLKILLDGVPGEAYNVSNPAEKISMRSLAELIAGLDPAGRTQVVFHAREFDSHYLENTYRDHAVIDSKKAAQLGWSCSVSLKEGFQRTITSFQDFKRRVDS